MRKQNKPIKAFFSLNIMIKKKSKTKTKSKKKKPASSAAEAGDSKRKKKGKKKIVKKERKTKKRKVAVKKVKKKKTKKERVEKEKEEKPDKFYQSVGKRKTAVARIRVWTKGEKEFLINKKPLTEYFPILEMQKVASASLERMKCVNKFKVSVIVKGGGVTSQAEAVRHGLAKVLVLFNPDFRKRLKKAGFLRRDARMRERKKFGLKRARRAPQWKKR